MSELISKIPEKDYLKGYLLEKALFIYGDKGLIEKYNNINQNDFSKNKNYLDNFLENLGLTMQQFSSNIQNSNSIIKELKADILNKIENSKLIAFGFQLPRNINDNPIRIPMDLLLNGKIDWNKSELEAHNLNFAGIRILINENDNSETKENLNKEKPDSISDYDPELHIDEKEAAKLLGLSPRTLQGYRLKGDGPKFIKIGKKTVRYKIADLKTWAESNKKNNTSEY